MDSCPLCQADAADHHTLELDEEIKASLRTATDNGEEQILSAEFVGKRKINLEGFSCQDRKDSSREMWKAVKNSSNLQNK